MFDFMLFGNIMTLLQWIAPQNINQKGDNEKIKIDLDDEYEVALNSASQEEIIDLAGKLAVFFIRIHHNCKTVLAFPNETVKLQQFLVSIL